MIMPQDYIATRLFGLKFILLSERPHAIFKLLSDPRGIGSALKSYRLAESHGHRSRARKVTPLPGQIEQPFDLDRRDRQVEIRGQQTNSAHKRIHSPVCGRAAFGEDERAVAPIHRLPGESEAQAESALLRQGEDVE